MISETEKYNRNLEEFSKLISYGTDLSNSLIGLRPESTNQLYGERIFVKLLCHGMTLVKISPAKEPKVDRELWDISSSYAVSRALVETFDALSYISLANITEREQEFRILFWTLHAEARRFDMLSKIGSNDPRVNKIKQDVETTKDQVINHSCIEMCPAHIKANIEKGKYQPYHLTQKQRNDEASISHEYHNTVTMHLSSHVHTHPFSVQQIIDFKAGNEECLGLMGISVQYATSYLAKAIKGMRRVFKDRAPLLDEPTNKIYEQWVMVAEHGVKIF